jgi:hypothetical protein
VQAGIYELDLFGHAASRFPNPRDGNRVRMLGVNHITLAAEGRTSTVAELPGLKLARTPAAQYMKEESLQGWHLAGQAPH